MLDIKDVNICRIFLKDLNSLDIKDKINIKIDTEILIELYLLNYNWILR